MERHFKAGLLAGTSALVLGLAMLPTPASAFERVSWQWDGQVTTAVNFDADIDVNIQLSGMAMVEDLQVSIGDIRAVSRVNNVSNNQPTEGSSGGPVTVDLGLLQFTGNYDQTSGDVTGETFAPELPQDQFLTGTVNTGDPFGVTMNFDLGEIQVETPEGTAAGPFDALTQLPSVVSTATAVANNTAIASQVSTQIHETQVAVGSARKATIGGSFGGLSGVRAANITALSEVSNILNASVDSSATAVANNLTVDLQAANAGDAALIMDAQQWSVAEVRAVSDVRRITLNNYENLGGIDGPIVSSSATAIGNNKSITVNVPSVSP